MRRTLLLLLAVLLLGFLYYKFVYSDNKSESSISIPDREFVVKDPADVNTITIKSKGYPLIHLNKEKNKWWINKNYPASDHVVNNMISVLSNMQIKYIPPASQNEMIRKSIENTAIEIKAYDSEGNLLTDIIMAGNTNAEDGTYILKRGADQAYVMAMPVVEGGLRNYFVHDIIALRDKTVFELETDEIKSIALTYPKDRQNSYTITKSNGSYSFKDYRNNEIESSRINPSVLNNYVRNFDKLVSEYISNDNPARDTIKNRVPFAVLEITAEDRGVLKMELFPDIDIYDPTINTLSVTDLGRAERYYTRTNWEDFYIIQHRLMSSMLRTPDYFMKK